jgi:hypothetical protein
LVTDGRHVYVAYGNVLKAIDSETGILVAQIIMPLTSDPFVLNPTIKSILFHRGRLVVILEGYGTTMIRRHGLKESVLPDFLNTHMRVYNTESFIRGDDEPISTAHLHGCFRGVYLHEDVVHITALTAIDTTTDLTALNQQEATNASEFARLSIARARKQGVPSFVHKLQSQLVMGDSAILDMVKLCMFHHSDFSRRARVEDLTFQESPLSALHLSHSFDLSHVTSSSTDRMQVASAGAFVRFRMCDRIPKVFGSMPRLIVAVPGTRSVEGAEATTDVTQLLLFRSAPDGRWGARMAPEAAGSVDGRSDPHSSTPCMSEVVFCEYSCLWRDRITGLTVL